MSPVLAKAARAPRAFARELKPNLGSVLLLALKVLIVLAFMGSATRPFIYQNF